MEQPGVFFLGLAIGASLIVVGFFLATATVRGVLATHDGSGNVHLCVNRFSGQTRVVLPGAAPNCTNNEVRVDVAGGGIGALLSALEERVDAIEAENQALREDLAALGAQVPECLSDAAGTALFSGCDVQIVNGLGSTASVNGTGNLIIGYNENSQFFTRTGSHNLVIGDDHGYSSAGGLVAGFQNVVSGLYASVTGGFENEASGNFSSVGGGRDNIASGGASSVSGGIDNAADGVASSVSGGFGNTASGAVSNVSGGQGNEASGTQSNVSGGSRNVASGVGSSISGGQDGEASGLDSSISGGSLNVASGNFSSVSGGSLNESSGARSSVTGGIRNEASGSSASVNGGQNNTADHLASTVGGTANRGTTADNQWIAGFLVEPS